MNGEKTDNRNKIILFSSVSLPALFISRPGRMRQGRMYFQMCLCGTVSPATGKFRSKTSLLGRSLLRLICARERRVSFSFLQLGEEQPPVPPQANSRLLSGLLC